MTNETESRSILDGYISERQLAEQIGRTVRTVRRWAALREGPPRTRVGKQVLYRLESVREWLASLEKDAAA